MAGERAAVAVAADEQPALQLATVDLELANFFAAPRRLRRSQTQQPTRLRTRIDIEPAIAAVLAQLVAADVRDAGLARRAHREAHAAAGGIEPGEVAERLLIGAVEQIDTERAAGQHEHDRAPERHEAVTHQGESR